MSSSSDRSSPPPPPRSDSDGGSKASSSDDSPTSSSSSSSKGDSPDHSKSAPSKSGSHSKHKKPSVRDSSSDHSSRIIGAAAGAALILVVIILVVICITRKKRKARKAKYYSNESQEYPSSYLASNNGRNWNNKGRFPPQSGGNATANSKYSWAMPSPPQAMMNSSQMNSSGFNSGPILPPPHPGVPYRLSQSTVSYKDLARATNGFSKSNLLGQGGFGFVYKGVLPNGKEVAVKTLKANSGQGEREFQAEVDIISRVHHRYLVTLVGHCTAGSRRILVYEYVPNGTLEFHLHGEGRPPLDWPTRLKIALGSAKGFAYLHEDCHPRIIHRDIKAANILLDSNFEAKVADFGLAKLSNDTNTHVSTRIMGTFGYLAPEYASTGKLTEKSDVFSFGVMLLELITGQRPMDLGNEEGDSLVDWVTPILDQAMEEGFFEELVDPRLGKNYNEQEMYRMVCCAAACIRPSAKNRPKMSQIVRALEGDVALDELRNKQGSALMGSRSSSESDLRLLANGDMALDELRNKHGTLKGSRSNSESNLRLLANHIGTSSSSSRELSNNGAATHNLQK